MTGLELPPGGQPTQKARYEFYQTSAAIIQRAGLKLYHPEPENIPDEQKCHEFIREPLPTDKRKNLLECRLRALCVYIDHRYKTADHMPLLETALSKKWAYKSFTRMVEKGATGSAVVTGPGGISRMFQSHCLSRYCLEYASDLRELGLFFQTPRDGMPFIAFCMTELPAEARRRQSDWVCLLLVTPDFDFRSVLHEDVFPADYGRLFPDFMYIPVRLLEDQVELIRDGLHGPTESLAQQTETLLHMNREDFSTSRKALFEIERTVRQLRDRWRFARELANTLMRCFAEIVRAHKLEVTAGSSIDRLYSKVLVQRVQTQIAIVEMMDLDLDSLPSAIQEQHRKVLGFTCSIRSSQDADVDARLKQS
ncbi:hypothetical protein BDV11DRAFT_200967 [Aspergillus similis]